jgi:F-type H+-transporting ATPase subunit b
MPQIAQISETFASQLFWLAIAFGLIYFVIGRGMLPKIQATVEQRDSRISEEAYRAQLEANRAEALKVTQAAKEASARETEQKVKAADAEIGQRVSVAEAEVRSAADVALAEIDVVAAEAAQEMVAKLSGATVSREQATQAVRAALANG